MQYTLQEAAALLDVDQKTLRKWLKDAEIAPVPDGIDLRRRLVSDDQVQTLARLHHRPIRTPTEVNAILKTLQRKVADLTNQVMTLRAQIDGN